MPADALTSDQRTLDPAAIDAMWRRAVRLAEPPWLHREIARRMAERLLIIKLQPATLVEWNGFAGASDELLASAYPKARRLIVEPTQSLVERTRESVKSSWWSPARWTGPEVHVVAPADVAPLCADLVWSNMTLHGEIDPPAVLAGWQRMLGEGGFVMFSCLGPDTLRELRALHATLGLAAPTIDFVDMHDLGDMMVHAGFADPVMDQERLTLTWPDADALLDELRSLGGNALPQRFAGLRGRGWLQRVKNGLGSIANEDGRIALTFEVSYGHAFKAAPRVKGNAETSVTLEEMRAMVRGGAQATRQR